MPADPFSRRLGRTPRCLGPGVPQAVRDHRDDRGRISLTAELAVRGPLASRGAPAAAASAQNECHPYPRSMLNQRTGRTVDDLRHAGELMARAWRADAPLV